MNLGETNHRLASGQYFAFFQRRGRREFKAPNCQLPRQRMASASVRFALPIVGASV